MVLKTELVQSDSETVFLLIGRITSRDVQQLKARIADARNSVALDLGQVDLVDLDAVYFLATAERTGITLRHLPPYVREWIQLERSRVGE
jgi:anti-anti-sigma regulatory factor